MFGMGGSEILVILIVALLFLGPDKLPEAAKQISKGIRDIKKQSRVLQRTIEDDEHIGGAIRDLKSALRGEDEPIRVTAKTILPAAATTVALPEGPDDRSALAAGDPDAVGSDASDPGAAIDADSPATVAGVVPGVGAPVATEAEAPTLRMSPTAGEPDDSTPRSTAADDAELAALVRPAPNTIARSTTRSSSSSSSSSPSDPTATESALPSDPSEPKHG